MSENQKILSKSIQISNKFICYFFATILLLIYCYFLLFNFWKNYSLYSVLRTVIWPFETSVSNTVLLIANFNKGKKASNILLYDLHFDLFYLCPYLCSAFMCPIRFAFLYFNFTLSFVNSPQKCQGIPELSIYSTK